MKEKTKEKEKSLLVIFLVIFLAISLYSNLREYVGNLGRQDALRDIQIEEQMKLDKE